jgi:hypothetical protein
VDDELRISIKRKSPTVSSEAFVIPVPLTLHLAGPFQVGEYRAGLCTLKENHESNG